MISAGLTGGIASGKSTVSGILRRAGARVIDADQIARQVVMPGLPAWQAIKAEFGDDVLLRDGAIDRGMLGEKVFNDIALRRKLEAIVHPHVREQMAAEIKRTTRTVPHAVVILDIPLLLEAHMMTQGLAEIIVVYAPEAVQLQRLMQRDGLNREAAQVRIKAQMPIEEKRRRASIVIDNSGDLAYTEKQTLAVYQNLRRRAAEG